MSYFNGYRIESARLSNYDYSSPGLYYVTFNTKHFICWFGRIELGKMKFSKAGVIANNYFREIPDHFQNVVLHEYVVMPNHIHGIIEKVQNISMDTGSNRGRMYSSEKSRKMSEISPKAGSLPAILRSYKSAVTRSVRMNSFEFKWQERYYDRIIRVSDPGELHRISAYIKNNPIQWYKDEFFNEGGSLL